MRLVVVAVLLVPILAGCTSEPTGVRRLADGSLIPDAAAVPSGVPQGAIIAAVVNRTAGGIAGWSSGASGVLVFSDGTVLRLQGQPWGVAGRTGWCAAEVQQALEVAARSLGRNGTIDCGRDLVADARMAMMGPDALSAIRDDLQAMAPATVPATRQTADCCDRVFTTRHLWVSGAETFLVDEQDGPPAPTSPNADGLLVRLSDLGAWARPVG
ncbi:MAG: hypothetical protein V4510_09170 [bacterium]